MSRYSDFSDRFNSVSTLYVHIQQVRLPPTCIASNPGSLTKERLCSRLLYVLDKPLRSCSVRTNFVNSQTWCHYWNSSVRPGNQLGAEVTYVCWNVQQEIHLNV